METDGREISTESPVWASLKILLQISVNHFLNKYCCFSYIWSEFDTLPWKNITDCVVCFWVNHYNMRVYGFVLYEV